MSTLRSNCWSITINNPSEDDLSPTLPAGWKMVGQLEKGEEGTEHYQGMLTTPQVRFSAVKKILPRAHIEVAKNKVALQKYVSKEETRLATVPDVTSAFPNIYDYQAVIVQAWDNVEFDRRREDWLASMPTRRLIGDVVLEYVDDLVEEDIRNGRRGAEYIAVNPMWRSAWKRFYKAILERSRLVVEEEEVENVIIPPQTDRQTDN